MEVPLLSRFRTLFGRSRKEELPREALEIARAGEKLRDLSEFGIHLDHEPFRCVRCKGEISPKWSSGLRIDTLCEACTPFGRDRYTPEANTVLVLRHDEAGRCYIGLVKIDGTLYYLESRSGGESALFSFPERRELNRRIGIGYWQLKRLAERGS